MGLVSFRHSFSLLHIDLSFQLHCRVNGVPLIIYFCCLFFLLTLRCEYTTGWLLEIFIPFEFNVYDCYYSSPSLLVPVPLIRCAQCPSIPTTLCLVSQRVSRRNSWTRIVLIDDAIHIWRIYVSLGWNEGHCPEAVLVLEASTQRFKFKLQV